MAMPVAVEAFHILTWAERYNAAEAAMRVVGRWPLQGELLRFSRVSKNAPVEERLIAVRRKVSFLVCVHVN